MKLFNREQSLISSKKSKQLTRVDVIVAEDENRTESSTDDHEMLVCFTSINVIESSSTTSFFVQDHDEQQDQQKLDELKEQQDQQNEDSRDRKQSGEEQQEQREQRFREQRIKEQRVRKQRIRGRQNLQDEDQKVTKSMNVYLR